MCFYIFGYSIGNFNLSKVFIYIFDYGFTIQTYILLVNNEKPVADITERGVADAVQIICAGRFATSKILWLRSGLSGGILNNYIVYRGDYGRIKSCCF